MSEPTLLILTNWSSRLCVNIKKILQVVVVVVDLFRNESVHSTENIRNSNIEIAYLQHNNNIKHSTTT